jgi:sec-independent protein translocase protein TatA
MGFSIANLVVILLIVLILFGAGKLPKVMGDLGKGLKNFKDGLNAKDEEAKQIADKENDNHRS